MHLFVVWVNTSTTKTYIKGFVKVLCHSGPEEVLSNCVKHSLLCCIFGIWQIMGKYEDLSVELEWANVSRVPSL